MKRVLLSEWGTDLHGRTLGAVVQGAIIEAAADGAEVRIDCTGVVGISLSFADEAIAGAVAHLGPRRPQPRLIFENVSDDVRAVMRSALANRPVPA